MTLNTIGEIGNDVRTVECLVRIRFVAVQQFGLGTLARRQLVLWRRIFESLTHCIEL